MVVWVDKLVAKGTGGQVRPLRDIGELSCWRFVDRSTYTSTRHSGTEMEQANRILAKALQGFGKDCSFRLNVRCFSTNSEEELTSVRTNDKEMFLAVSDDREKLTPSTHSWFNVETHAFDEDIAIRTDQWHTVEADLFRLDDLSSSLEHYRQLSLNQRLPKKTDSFCCRRHPSC